MTTEAQPQETQEMSVPEQVTALLQDLGKEDRTEAGNLKREFDALAKEKDKATATLRKAIESGQDLTAGQGKSALDNLATVGGRYNAFPSKVQDTLKNIAQVKVDRANAVLAEALHPVYMRQDVQDALKAVHGDLKNAHSSFDYTAEEGAGKVNRIQVNTATPAVRRSVGQGGGRTRSSLTTYDNDHPLGRKNIGKHTIFEVDGQKYTAGDLNKEFASDEVKASASWINGDRNLPHWSANTVYNLAEAGRKVVLHNE